VNRRKNLDKVFCIKHSISVYPDVMAKFEIDSKSSTNIGPKIAVEELMELREKERMACDKEKIDSIPLYKNYLRDKCYTDI
ncbi:MAG: hypothetical protein LBT02_02030, partial [Rickettsiales bacterium]|jgi:hypothetical protein|nr:hypothetical protein [Rickettsiales bacterium]